MHYWPEIYPEDIPVWGQWDYFAEQLMMYILGQVLNLKDGPELYYKMGN